MNYCCWLRTCDAAPVLPFLVLSNFLLGEIRHRFFLSFFFSRSLRSLAALFSIFAFATDTHYYYYVWRWSCGDCAVAVVFLVNNFSHPFHCTFFNYTLFSRAHRRCRWPAAAGAISAIAKFICTFLSRKFNLPKLQIACELQPTNTGTGFVWHKFILKCNSVNK